MKENVIIVNCKAADEAEKILDMLRKKPDAKGINVSHAAIVKKDAGELSLEDGFVADSAEGDLVWTGGLIGGLVGLLGGPVGALIAGGVGALIGNGISEVELKGATALLEKASECLVDGETALLVLAQAKDEAAIAKRLGDFEVTVTCLDAKEIAEELELAKKLGKKAQKKSE